MEAENGVALMTETAERKRKEEQAKGGLIIVEAKYGKLNTNNILDVTIPLQCLVRDSELVLHNTPKAYLPGFYNPSTDIDDILELEISYLYRDKLKYVKIQDKDPLTLPKDDDKN